MLHCRGRIRQAWPFLGFADNRPTPARELRLYVDARWRVGSAVGDANDHVAWLAAAVDPNGETVTKALIEVGGTLTVETSAGISVTV